MKAGEIIEELKNLCVKNGHNCEVAIQCDYGNLDDLIDITKISYDEESGTIMIIGKG